MRTTCWHASQKTASSKNASQILSWALFLLFLFPLCFVPQWMNMLFSFPECGFTLKTCLVALMAYLTCAMNLLTALFHNPSIYYQVHMAGKKVMQQYESQILWFRVESCNGVFTDSEHKSESQLVPPEVWHLPFVLKSGEIRSEGFYRGTKMNVAAR